MPEIDKLTIRGKSIAIVTRGKMLGDHGQYFLPIMDWLVAQIKHYANVDCYPFLIRPTCNLEDVLADLSNTYSGVLFLDSEELPYIQT